MTRLRIGLCSNGPDRFTPVPALWCLLCCLSFVGSVLTPGAVMAEDRDAALAALKAVDPFMGDWQGEWELDDGSDWGALVAQVIALGDGHYRVKVVEGFDLRVEPYAVLDGKQTDAGVVFEGKSVLPGNGMDLTIRATIAGDKMSGTFKVADAYGEQATGKVSLKRTIRLSPTLGMKPLAGAVVLFDGNNFDEWEQLGTRAGVVNLHEVVGRNENAAAYMLSRIWSQKKQEAKIELGSDDGVKVWLNGELVHANNAARGVQPGQDRFDVALKNGWNELLVKVTNGGGDWGAIVRLVNPDRRLLRGVREMISAEASDTGSDEYLKKNRGNVTIWQVAGPFKKAGVNGEGLFDVEFEPEKDVRSVDWKQVNANLVDEKKVRWKLLDGAMEAAPGAGSIVTKRKFKDFKLHIEFRTPFMPTASGQGRGNSGVYLQNRYEVQVLDSYALEGLDNECGGIYKVGKPLVNMCAPPMQWQTYDIEFKAPRFEGGKKAEDAKVTVRHNGVTIHSNLALPGPTGGALDGNVDQPGGIYLQDHGNPVRFRNIWLVETK